MDLDAEKGKITIPVVRWITLTTFLLIPEFWLAHTHPWYEPIVSIMMNGYNYLAIVLSILILSSYLGKKFGERISKIIDIIFFIFVLAYSISQSFLWINFYRHWDQFIFQLIFETTLRESSEFLSSYILTSKFLLLICLYTLAIVLCIYSDHKVCQISLPDKLWKRMGIMIFILSVYSQIYFISGSLEENYKRAAGWPVKRTAIFNLRQSMLQMREYIDESVRCAQTLCEYSYCDSIPDNAPDIVWIIGESYNRHHSSLYGYYLLTSPNMLKRMEDGRLYKFEDVIAPFNSTSHCLKYCMSMASTGDSISWYDAPLFPAIFKGNRWNVVYYSNQFTIKDDLDQWDASMGFINHPIINEHLFTKRNHSTFDYDMQLVDDYIQHRSEIEDKDHNLVIFHLYGQHIEFHHRYPPKETVFHAKDIKSDFSEQQKEIIAQYDNATLYNDSVVERIIKLFEDRNAVIIYFADHGEEVYDFRNQMGRTSLVIDESRAQHQQLDIPFFIIPTAKCIESHPDIPIHLAKALKVPFMTDDFPHLLFDLIGAKSPWLNKAKSPLNEHYTIKKRYIQNSSRVYERSIS